MAAQPNIVDRRIRESDEALDAAKGKGSKLRPRIFRLIWTRRRLLHNEPLLRTGDWWGARASSAGEAAALESVVGLAREPYAAELHRGLSSAGDPLVQSVADYMALIETS